MLELALDLGQIVSVSFMVAAIFKRANIVTGHRVPLVAMIVGMLMGASMGFQAEGFSGILGGMLIGLSGLASTGFWEGAKSLGGDDIEKENLSYMGDEQI